MFRGYDDTAYWGLDGYLTDIILPVLKYYRSGNQMGLPFNDDTGDSHTEESWDAELDKMIRAFEMFHKEDHEGEMPPFEEWQRISKEGLESFAKNYHGLWD